MTGCTDARRRGRDPRASTLPAFLSSELDDPSQLVYIDVPTEHQTEHRRGHSKQSHGTLEESDFGLLFGLRCDGDGRSPTMSMLLSHISEREARLLCGRIHQLEKFQRDVLLQSLADCEGMIGVGWYWMLSTAGRGRAEK